MPRALRPHLWYLLAALSGLLALKTKEIAVTLPLAVILYEVCFHGYSVRKGKIMAILAGAGILAAGGWLLLKQPDFEGLAEGLRASSTAITRSDYLVTQFAVIATYLRLLVLPVNQNLDYDYPVYMSLLQPKPLLGLLLHLALIGGALWTWRKAHSGTGDRGPGNSTAGHSPFTVHHLLIAFGILWFYLTLMVESSIIPIQDVIVEHRLYLPSVGLLTAAAAAGTMLAARIGWGRLAVAASVIVLCLTVATVQRNRVWNSEEALWRDVAAKSPGKPRVLMALGNIAAAKGDSEGALGFYFRAVERDPSYFMAHLNIGVVLLQLGDAEGAIRHLQEARSLAPDRAAIYYQLGRAYDAKGFSNNSIPFFSRAVDLAPENSSYRAALQQARGASPPGLAP